MEQRVVQNGPRVVRPDGFGCPDRAEVFRGRGRVERLLVHHGIPEERVLIWIGADGGRWGRRLGPRRWWLLLVLLVLGRSRARRLVLQPGGAARCLLPVPRATSLGEVGAPEEGGQLRRRIRTQLLGCLFRLACCLRLCCRGWVF